MARQARFTSRVGGGKELTGNGKPLVVRRVMQVCKMERKWKKARKILKNCHPLRIKPVPDND